MQSTMKVELFSSGVNAWPTCYLSARFLVLLLPTKSVQTQEMPCRLPKVPLSRQTFWVAQGKRLLIRTPQGRMFPGLIEFCGQGYLRSSEQSQHISNFCWPSGQAVVLEWVVSMPIYKYQLVFILLNQRCPLILMLCWLVLLLWGICKNGSVFRPSWG